MIMSQSSASIKLIENSLISNMLICTKASESTVLDLVRNCSFVQSCIFLVGRKMLEASQTLWETSVDVIR